MNIDLNQDVLQKELKLIKTKEELEQKNKKIAELKEKLKEVS